MCSRSKMDKQRAIESRSFFSFVCRKKLRGASSKLSLNSTRARASLSATPAPRRTSRVALEPSPREERDRRRERLEEQGREKQQRFFSFVRWCVDGVFSVSVFFSTPTGVSLFFLFFPFHGAELPLNLFFFLSKRRTRKHRRQRKKGRKTLPPSFSFKSLSRTQPLSSTSTTSQPLSTPSVPLHPAPLPPGKSPPQQVVHNSAAARARPPHPRPLRRGARQAAARDLQRHRGLRRLFLALAGSFTLWRNGRRSLPWLGGGLCPGKDRLPALRFFVFRRRHRRRRQRAPRIGGHPPLGRGARPLLRQCLRARPGVQLPQGALVS